MLDMDGPPVHRQGRLLDGLVKFLVGVAGPPGKESAVVAMAVAKERIAYPRFRPQLVKSLSDHLCIRINGQAFNDSLKERLSA
jgi:hypothetical protein|tara:strand:- start:214 stop:462 length:249 start_codon:yes stop_codon:yes gene_type:complete